MLILFQIFFVIIPAYYRNPMQAYNVIVALIYNLGNLVALSARHAHTTLLDSQRFIQMDFVLFLTTNSLEFTKFDYSRD